ncbi:alpha/beta fold hydrolase [uncultured Ruthenibacterium sp.]|uniref:alpha/beta fold hydrolase n=1 Tax=uncultured Ruthenibacterium sp. TaxID=1905347 RepID=UPI00349EAC3C
MDTTVVLFPGIGYGVDRPLFYYARKQAQQHGCRLICVKYRPFERDPALSLEQWAQAVLPGCVDDALAQLNSEVQSRWVFIGKSLGTLVAGEVARRMGVHPVHIFLTPLPQTYERYMRGQPCWAVYGTQDPLMTQACSQRMSQDVAVHLTAIPGADHSLEVPGDVVASVDALRKVAALYCTLF